MAKKDKKKEEPPKADKKSGGILGRLFGGGKGDPKGGGDDAPAVPADDDLSPDMAKTIPPDDRDGPFDDPAEARTLPPFEAPASVKGKKATPAASPFDDEAEARTLPPFDRPKNTRPSPVVPADVFSPEAMTLPPMKPDDVLDLDEDLGEATIPPRHLMQPPKAPPPKAPKKGRAGGEDAITQDPLLTPAAKGPSKDPFAFEDDILGGPLPPPAAPPPAQDDLGFGDDVLDIMDPPKPVAPPPPPGRAAAKGADPFGSPLADDPFEFAPDAAKGGPLVPASKTDEIPSFEVDLGASPGSSNPNWGVASAAPTLAPQRDEQTMEMERPPAQVQTPPKAAPKRTLFASQVARPDGTRRFGPPAPEVQLDHDKGTLHAPPVPGGWSEVPAFAAVLSDGSVVGRLPRGVKYEGDGSFVLPAASRREPDASGRVPAFPAGVVVDRAASVAFVTAEQADLVAGSPEATLRLEDGSLVLSIPAGATWNEDGSYTVARPGAGTGSKPDEAPSPHGAVVFTASYLGCTETVYEDGWARLALPKTAKVEGELVLLPASSRQEPGAVPELLEVEARKDGVVLRLPPGYVPEGDTAWLPPADVAAEAIPDLVETDWGEPTEELDYCGVHEALYPNGWTRLDLPPGARVVGRKLMIPHEYEHAGDAAAVAQFDRDVDGSLVDVLPADAEALGSVVLIPPEGVRTFFAPPAPSEPTIRRSSGGDSVMPPSGGGVSSPKTKGLDRFRAKKAAEDEKPSPVVEEKKPDEAPKAEEKKAEEPKADEGADDADDKDDGSPDGSGGIKRRRKKSS
jgi:hypothetical protein